TSFLAICSVALPAHANPESFIQSEHQKLERLLHQPPSPARETQVHQALDGFVDYDELTRRAFGEPCPRSMPGCEDLWVGYNDAQKSELRDLLARLVRKNYEKNLKKTLDYDIDYRGERATEGDTRVLTEAKNRLKPRDPAVRVDYIVKETPAGLRVVDILTE